MASRHPGIYCLKSKIDDRLYIGSSVNIYNRFKEHKHKFLNNIHANKLLQNFVNKYGFENLEFVVLESILVRDNKYILEREQYYLDSLNCEFNIRKIAESNLGISWGHHSEETKEKLRKASTGNKNMLGKKLSLETKRKMSERMKGISKNLGKPRSEETKNKIRISNTGKKQTEEQKNKKSLSKARLTKEDLLQMFELRKEGLSYIEIGKIYNFTRENVRSILTYKTKYTNLLLNL